VRPKGCCASVGTGRGSGLPPQTQTPAASMAATASLMAEVAPPLQDETVQKGKQAARNIRVNRHVIGSVSNVQRPSANSRAATPISHITRPHGNESMPARLENECLTRPSPAAQHKTGHEWRVDEISSNRTGATIGIGIRAAQGLLRLGGLEEGAVGRGDVGAGLSAEFLLQDSDSSSNFAAGAASHFHHAPPRKRRPSRGSSRRGAHTAHVAQRMD
jgi:hypothetical protein